LGSGGTTTARLKLEGYCFWWCMAVGGAWVDLSSVDSANERDYRQLLTSAWFQV